MTPLFPPANAMQRVIAVIFDFDDTLTDDSTTRFLQSKGVNAEAFWKTTVDARVKAGWDPSLAYLDPFLELVGPGRPLGEVTNAELREFGRTLEFYPGLPDLFARLRTSVSTFTLSRPTIEFHVVSGGLEEVIRGSRVAGEFSGIWGCTFAEADGRIAAVKNIVSFTDKTRFLYGINKGVDGAIRSDPFVVNRAVDHAARRVPFEHMIYVGDGLTDIPCFSLVQNSGGQAFGVFDPKKAGAPKKAWELLGADRRVATLNPPNYGETEALGALIQAAVISIGLRMEARTRSV